MPKNQKNYPQLLYLPNKINEKVISIKKELIIKLLKKEGVQGLIDQYGGINNLPIFKNKIAYGKKNFPWSLQKKNKKKN